MEYTKLDPNDPDPDQIPDAIIRLSHQNQMLRGPLEMFLSGVITYRECLENIILMITKEYNAQGKILVEVLQEKPSYALAITGATGRLVKALPRRPLETICPQK
jgi:hypothetical protein